MCPRGEVSAGIITISVRKGIHGQAVAVAVLALVIYLVMSGAFIMAVKVLAKRDMETDQLPVHHEVRGLL